MSFNHAKKWLISAYFRPESAWDKSSKRCVSSLKLSKFPAKRAVRHLLRGFGQKAFADASRTHNFAFENQTILP